VRWRWALAALNATYTGKTRVIVRSLAGCIGFRLKGEIVAEFLLVCSVTVRG